MTMTTTEPTTEPVNAAGSPEIDATTEPAPTLPPTPETAATDPAAVVPGMEMVKFHNPNSSPLQRPPQSFGELAEMANAIANSSLVPKAYRGKPNDIILAGLTGAEQGWPLTVSMRWIYVVDGKPSFAAEAIGAKIRQAGHVLKVSATSHGCLIVGTRRDTGEVSDVSFTIDDARRAELLQKDNWRKYPMAMCYARALTALSRMLFQDVMMGLGYTPEELDGDDHTIESVEVDLYRATNDVDASAALWRTISDEYPKLSEASQGRVDAWLRRLKFPSGDHQYPNGFADINADADPALLSKLNQNILRASIDDRRNPDGAASAGVGKPVDAVDYVDSEVLEPESVEDDSQPGDKPADGLLAGQPEPPAPPTEGSLTDQLVEYMRGAGRPLKAQLIADHVSLTVESVEDVLTRGSRFTLTDMGWELV